MNGAKAAVAGGAAALVLIGGLVYTQLDKWFSPEPPSVSSEQATGPGSGDELPDDYVDPNEATGPGSGDELPPDPEPTGPGSGDELPDDYVEPPSASSGQATGPGSGDEEPQGPGSGDEVVQADEKLDKVKGSCNKISFGSVCVEYIGSFWANISYAIQNCADQGAWSEGPCPRPSLGGCNISAGTANEIIIHYYNYGGDPITPDNMPNVIGVCNANPFATWLFGV